MHFDLSRVFLKENKVIYDFIFTFTASIKNALAYQPILSRHGGLEYETLV